MDESIAEILLVSAESNDQCLCFAGSVGNGEEDLAAVIGHDDRDVLVERRTATCRGELYTLASIQHTAGSDGNFAQL
jgi:hypothetical protein